MSMPSRVFRPLLASVVVMATYGGATAYAASTGTPTTVPTCTNGKVWDKKKKKCVKPAQDSGLSDDNLFEAARDLAYNRRYEEAQTVLRLAQNQDDPRILNYLGFTTRKLGNVEGSLTYYKAALSIDPDYTLVREYMGEAYIQLGQFERAAEQLAEIRKRCGTDCREYRLLRAELDKARLDG